MFFEYFYVFNVYGGVIEKKYFVIVLFNYLKYLNIYYLSFVWFILKIFKIEFFFEKYMIY